MAYGGINAFGATYQQQKAAMGIENNKDKENSTSIPLDDNTAEEDNSGELLESDGNDVLFNNLENRIQDGAGGDRLSGAERLSRQASLGGFFRHTRRDRGVGPAAMKSSLNLLSVRESNTDLYNISKNIGKNIKDIIAKKYGQNYKSLVFLLDSKQRDVNAAYSNIIVAISYDTQEGVRDIGYCPVIVEADSVSRRQLVASSAASIIRAKESEEMLRERDTEKIKLEKQLAVPSDSFDEYLTGIIEPSLVAEFETDGLKLQLTPVDSVVAPIIVEDLEEVLPSLALVAANKILGYLSYTHQLYQEADIGRFLRENNNVRIGATFDYRQSMVCDLAGRPHLAQSRTEIEVNDRGFENEDSINHMSSTFIIGSISHYVDHSLAVVDLNAGDPNTNTKNEQMCMRGDIVITHMNSDEESLGRLLLSAALAAGVNMNDTGYLNTIWRDGNCTVGKLNLITNSIGGEGKDKSPRPVEISSANKRITEAEIPSLIRSIIPYDKGAFPRLSVDIIIGGEYNSFYTTLIMAGMYKSEEAQRALVQTAIDITDGFFDPANVTAIFLDNFRILPYAVYKDNNGNLIDARVIDLPHVADATNGNTANDSLVYKYLKSNSDSSHPMDAYYNRLEVIAEFAPDAIVLGKIVRLTFEPSFIVELNRALVECNVNLRLKYPISDSTDSGGLFSLARSNYGSVTGFDTRNFRSTAGPFSGLSSLGRFGSSDNSLYRLAIRNRPR